jgi:raffinose/stachyose/melibiose transport system substrate-binding protein
MNLKLGSRGIARSIFVTLAAIASCLVLTVSAGAKGERQQAVTLRILANTSWAAPLNVLTANFKKAYPGIDFDIQIVSSAQQGPLMSTQLRAGNAADIFVFGGGRASPIGVNVFSDQKLLVDLQGRPFTKRLVKGLRVGLQTGKSIWGVPMGVSLTSIMAYNVDMFAGMGIRIPTTFAQMLNVCRKITAAGKIPMAIGLADTARIAFFFANIGNAVYAKDPTWNTKRLHGKTTFAGSALWRRAYQQILDMKNADCFSKGASGVTSEQAPAQFARGDAAMYPGASQQASLYLSVNPKLNFRTFALPADKAKDTLLMEVVTGILGLNAATSGEKKDAALKFLDFAGRPFQQDAFNNAAGGLLSAQDLIHHTTPAYAPPLKPLQAILKRPRGSAIDPRGLWPNPSVNTVVGTGLQGLFTGQKTIDQVLADMDAAFNKGRG